MPHVMVFMGQPPGHQDSSFPQPAPEPGFLLAMLFNTDVVFSMSSKIRTWILLPQNQFSVTFLSAWNSAVSLHSQQEDSRMHNPLLAIIETMA